MAENITRILVPTDFSPTAERAFGYATTLAQHFGATLGLLHVVEDRLSGAWSSEVYVPSLAKLLEGFIADAEQHLARFKHSAAALGLSVETKVISGQPAHAILERAKEGGFDLIVMGTHGYTGLSHLVMGSVAERVVRKAPCPVLTVHADDAAGAAQAPVAADGASDTLTPAA